MAAIAQAGPLANVAGADDKGEGQEAAGAGGAASWPVAHNGQYGGQWRDILHTLSHDIRTPLNAVIGFSDMMHAEMLGPLGHHRYQEYVRHIRESGALLLRAAEEALAVTGLLSSGLGQVRKPVCLLEPLESAWQQIRPGGLETVRPLTLNGDTATVVLADARVLEQALRFLLCFVAVRVDARSPDVTFRIDPVGTQIELAILYRIRCASGDSSAPLSQDSVEGDRSITYASALVEAIGGSVFMRHEAGGQIAMILRLEAPVQRDLFRS